MSVSKRDAFFGSASHAGSKLKPTMYLYLLSRSSGVITGEVVGIFGGLLKGAVVADTSTKCVMRKGTVIGRIGWKGKRMSC